MEPNNTDPISNDNGATNPANTDPAPVNTGTTNPVNTDPAPPPLDYSWAESYADEDKEYLRNKGFKDPNQLYKSYRELEKAYGGKVFASEVPGEDASQEVIDAFYNKLGRPETADAYKLEGDAVNQADPEMMKWIKETGHKIGLTQKQMEQQFAALSEYGKNMEDQANQNLTMKNQMEMDELKQSWGFSYDNKTNVAREAAKKFFGDNKDLMDSLVQSAGPKQTYQALYEVGKALGLEKAVHGDPTQGDFRDPANIDREVDNLFKDPSFLADYNSPNPAISQKAIDKITSLYKMKELGR